MSIALEMKVRALEALVEMQALRLDALERTVTASPRRLGVLYAQAAAMRAQGDALKAEIRAILEAHKGPRRLKAYAVLTMIKREPPPSLRRVQEILRALRAESAVSR
jgi:hypothetical protein